MNKKTKSVLLVLGMLSTSVSFAQTNQYNSNNYSNPNSTNVSGYNRENGTYVAPYERSQENNSKSDNWSSRGNINPQTGQEGHKSY